MKTEELTEQEKIWRSEFGELYNLRNTYTNDGLDEVFIKVMGVSRTDINKEFISSFDKDINILEVGCNIGMMLVNLQEMGFRKLNGLEIQPKAIETALQTTKGINYTEGSAYKLPFKDNEFDLVFTCHVLIHLPPGKIEEALKEMVRCSRKYVYCQEYYAKEITEIKNYHGKNNIVWKRDFEKLFEREFVNLKLLKSRKYNYSDNDNVETVFLFEKESNK